MVRSMTMEQKNSDYCLGALAEPLCLWYEKNKRSMPWRDDATPYHVWLSEIMLQQTRIEAAKEYYYRFIERLPDVQSLAEVPEEELMKLWEGLGYYNRARNLQKAAKLIVERYEGRVPASYDLLLELPSKMLCQEDCRGLCPICGKDLNEGPCGCEHDTTDPRWDALKSLFQDE